MSVKPVRGLRSYYPTDKGPIDTYQLGKNGRVEYLAAEIATDHLKKGNDTTEEWKKWAKERGNASDEPGLILSHRLGGIGTDKANLFPKSPLLDKTKWGEHEKAAAEEAAEMKKWKKLKFSARLEYPSDDSTRPSSIEYQYDLPSGSILYGKVNNEPVADASSEEEVEEQEESEYEEEEEEEVEEAESKEETEEETETTVVENKIEPVQESAQPTAAPEEKVAPEPVREPEKVPEKLPEKSPEKEPQVPAIKTVVQPPTPPVIEKSPSPPPPPPKAPIQPPPPAPTTPVNKPRDGVAPCLLDDSWKKPVPAKDAKSTKDQSSKSTIKDLHLFQEQSRGVITTSDLVDLIPVIGSCKLAVETAQALFNGNGRVALRKAVQCGISLVADFYLGRAIARHGQILANEITEQAVIRFVTKAENQIIIVSTFKATNQLLSTISRVLS